MHQMSGACLRVGSNSAYLGVHGQLGHGDTEVTYLLTYLLTYLGVHGQLGHGDTEVRLAPCPVEALADASICRVSAADNHTLAIDTEGRVFGWGDTYEVSTPMWLPEPRVCLGELEPEPEMGT